MEGNSRSKTSAVVSDSIEETITDYSVVLKTGLSERNAEFYQSTT